MAARFIDVLESQIFGIVIFSRIITSAILLKQLVTSGSANIPGAPLTNFNGGDGGTGGGGSDRGSYFYTPKNHTFRICLPKKITTFFSIPKKIP